MSGESTIVDFAATRRTFEAFDRRDIDGMLAVYTPDAVLDMSPIGMGVFQGREAIRGFYEDWRSSYEDFEQVVEEMRDLGNGVGLAVTAAHGRLRGSASRLELHYAGVGIWTNGLVERHTFYTDIDAARAAAQRLADERGQGASGNRVALVDGLFGLWNNGDRDFAVFSKYLDPAIELEGPLSSVVGEPYRGYAGIGRWMSDIDEHFVQWSIRADEMREVGTQVVAVVTVTARGRGSDIALRLHSAGVIDFAPDRRVTRVRIYSDVSEALKLVGLED